MKGSSSLRLAGLVATLGLTLVAACVNAGADYVLLDRFFAASRLLDRTALARIATVVFDPQQDGIVFRFRIESIQETGPRQRDIEIHAAVRSRDGVVTERRMIVTTSRLAADAVTGTPDRWIVTGFR